MKTMLAFAPKTYNYPALASRLKGKKEAAPEDGFAQTRKEKTMIELFFSG
jgi:hypothetical protein